MEELEAGGWAILVLPSGLSLSPSITFSATIIEKQSDAAVVGTLAMDLVVDDPVVCIRGGGRCLEVSRALLAFASWSYRGQLVDVACNSTLRTTRITFNT